VIDINDVIEHNIYTSISHFNSFYRYENPDIALNCGMILRECLRHESLTKIILYSPQFYDFFTYVEMSTFDIASDAFATFKVSESLLNNSYYSSHSYYNLLITIKIGSKGNIDTSQNFGS
jgi:hypothetical protein